jgi:hypothetical protein
MPNWCYNIINAKQEIIDYITTTTSDNNIILDFNTIAKEPEENEDWYNWRVFNWGCKWNANTINISETSIAFETPWSPPEAFYRLLSLEFPDDEIEVFYEEAGMGFSATDIYLNGEIMTSEDERWRLYSDCPVCYGYSEIIDSGYDYIVSECVECGSIFKKTKDEDNSKILSSKYVVVNIQTQ